MFDVHGFLTITNKSITISGAEGWRMLCIKNSSLSTTSATISSSSTKTIGANAQTSISLGIGESMTIGSGQSSIDGVTINAPSGCTLYIQAVTNAPNIGG